MTKEREFDVTFGCRFCGRRWAEKWFDNKNRFFDGCENCTISTTARKGTRVRYAGALRDHPGAVYADWSLIRCGVYTVLKTKPWQHGCYVYLQEFSSHSFHLRLFTPEKYEFHQDTAPAIAACPAGFSIIGEDKVIHSRDLIWNGIEKGFLYPSLEQLGQKVEGQILVIRPNDMFEKLHSECQKCGILGRPIEREGAAPQPCVYCGDVVEAIQNV